MRVDEALRVAREALSITSNEAALDARLLLAHVLNVVPLELVIRPERSIEKKEISSFLSLIDRRKKHEPLAYILGQREFYGRTLQVTRDTLVPRADTEMLIDVVLQRALMPSALFADIGTGSGAIAVTLCAERLLWSGVGVDISAAALLVAQTNALRHDVFERCRFMEGRWAAAFGDSSLDVLVSNPPYIRREEMLCLEPQVREYEPHLALDGGEDGLEAYLALIEQGTRVLKPGGLIAFEVGFDQGQAVVELLQKNSYQNIEIKHDLSGHERVVSGFRKA
jgi:release factor glutamine methyltransferase